MSKKDYDPLMSRKGIIQYSVKRNLKKERTASHSKAKMRRQVNT